MRLHPGNGIWEIFLPGVPLGARYKYEIIGRDGGLLALKTDPVAFAFEPDEPRTASVVADLNGFTWGDAEWMDERKRRNALHRPMSVYEVHLGSWRRAEPGTLPELPGARRAARRLRERDGLHPRGAHADHRASLLRLLGLPDHRLLRADPPLRHARRLHGVRGHAPPARHRRDPGLGARALPQGRPRARLLRRHPPLRARRSEPARPPRLGHPRVQLRPPRGRATSSSPTRCSGSSATTSTACAWTRSRR